MKKLTFLVVGLAVMLTASVGSAQAPPEYGSAITLEQAKKVMAGAEAERCRSKHVAGAGGIARAPASRDACRGRVADCQAGTTRMSSTES